MINKIRESITQLQISIDILSQIFSCVYDLIMFCSEKDPYTMKNQDNSNYYFSIPNLVPLKILNTIQDELQIFNRTFFDPEKSKNFGTVEKKYLSHLYNLFYSEDYSNSIGIIFFLYESKNLSFLSEDQLDFCIGKMKKIINTFDKLIKIYELTINQNNITYKEYKKRELDIINALNSKIGEINNDLSSIFFLSDVKSSFSNIIENILQAEKNGRITIHKEKIHKELDKISSHLKDKKIFIGAIFSLYNTIESEIRELNSHKQIQENNLDNLLEYTNQIQNEKTEEIRNKKLQDFRDENNQIENLSKVFSKARDPKTAIKHMQKGELLKRHFSNSEKEFDISTTNPYNSDTTFTKTDIIEKREVNTWYEYGKKSSDLYKEKLTETTTIGVNLKDLLKNSGLDSSIFDDFTKK